MKVLLIEDDKNTIDFIQKGLHEAGHSVVISENGKEGLFQALELEFDVMVIDRMLPGLDGLSIISTIRNAHIKTPIIILSALSDVNQRVEGLKSGADDYLSKPFAFSELLARLEVLTRRIFVEEQQTILTIDDLEMDLLSHQVKRAGKVLDLQSREYRLLEYLLKHQGQVVTRTMLLENVWDYHFDPQTNIIDVHISRLRAKVDKGFENPLIHTVRGAGYTLRVDEKNDES
ncbi:MAG TPA: response regulator transcription factor [Aeromonadales bacterium]|nr:response regulator transcription factor [Aeromonadales bacterium]